MGALSRQKQTTHFGNRSSGDKISIDDISEMWRPLDFTFFALVMRATNLCETPVCEQEGPKKKTYFSWKCDIRTACRSAVEVCDEMSAL